MKKRILSIVLAVLMLLSVLPVTAMAADGTTDTPVTMTSGNTDGPKLKKTAQWEDKNAGIAKITMEVWGEPSQQSTEFGPTDIVLVIDKSGSMKGDRITKAKNAAKEFVEQFLGEKGTDSSRANVQIGIVTYNKEAQPVSGLTNVKSTLDIKINEITAPSGGTNIQAGIHAAQTMLDKDTRTGVAKYMVVLSDGEPKNSYRFDANATYKNCKAFTRIDCPWGGETVNVGPFTANYDKIIGEGTDFEVSKNARIIAKCTKHGDTKEQNVNYKIDGTYSVEGKTNHGVATIWEANQAKANGTTIYSIGFGNEIGTAQNPNNAYKTMVAIASGADKYKAASESDVSNVFDAIATEIKSYTAYNAVVTDPMGAGFTVIESNADYPITVANGETTNVDANGNLVWDVAKELDENHHTITFYIQYNTATVSDNNNPLPTNDGAELTFTTDKEGKVPGTPVTVGNPELPNPSKKVSYDDGYNGAYATGAAYEEGYYWPESEVNVAPAPANGPAGYVFGGWETKDTAVANGKFTVTDKDIKFTAKWIEDPSTVPYEITKEWVGQVGESATFQITYNSGETVYGEETLTVANQDGTDTNKWVKSVDLPVWQLDKNGAKHRAVYQVTETKINDTALVNGRVEEKNSDNLVTGTWTSEAITNGNGAKNTYQAAQTYSVTYGWATAAPSSAKLPTGTADLLAGSTYTVTAEGYEDVADTVNGKTGVWHFEGWKHGDKTVTKGTKISVNDDIVIEGSWSFTNNKYMLRYIWGDPNPGTAADLPSAKFNLEQGESYDVDWPTTTSIVGEKNGVPGTWTFKHWTYGGQEYSQNSKVTMGSSDITMTGIWEFTPNEKAGVRYVYVSGTEGKDLPSDIHTIFAVNDTTEYYVGQPVTNKGPQINSTTYPMSDHSGTWTLTSWRASSDSMVEGGVTFTGTWTFVAAEQPKYKVIYTFESGTTGEALPNEVRELLPADHTEYTTGNTVAPVAPSKTEVSVTNGKWEFKGWNPSETQTFEASNITFTGTWKFTKTEQPPEPPQTKYEITLTISKELRVRSGSHPGEWTFWFDVSYYAGDDVFRHAGEFSITLADGQTDKQETVTVTVNEDAYYAILRGASVRVEERDLGENGFEYDTTPGLGTAVVFWVGTTTNIVDTSNVRPTDNTLYITPFPQAGNDFDFVNYYGKSGKVEKPVKVGPQLNRDDHVAYIMGYPDGRVRPEGEITRAEACTIFFRLLTESSRDYYFSKVNDYTDVARGDWFNNAISTLSNAGIVTGYNDGTFRPNQPITRGEMAKIIANFANLSKGGKSFTDLSGHWSKTYVELAAGNGWIAGYPDGSFRPDQKITRAETVTMINRVLERVPAKESRLLSRSIMLTFPDNKPGDWYYIAIQEASNSHEYQRSVYETTGDEMWTKLIDNVDWTKLEK